MWAATTSSAGQNIKARADQWPPPVVRERFRQAQTAGDSFVVSAVVVFELHYGAAKSQHPQATEARLEAFLAGPLDVLPLDEDDAVDAGTARAALERVGTSIGVYETC